MAVRHYKMKLKTLSPVHIGSGETIGKTEAIIDSVKKTVYIPDTVKLFGGLTELGLAEEYEIRIMGGTGFDLLKFLQNNRVKPETWLSWVKYSYPLGSMEPKGMNISACVKDAYSMPYIPGSSIKGAIRTAIVAAELMNDPALTIDDKLGKPYNIKEKLKTMERLEAETEVELFHTIKFDEHYEQKIKKSNAVRSVFRGLRISDSEPVPTDRITLCQKIDMFPDGGRKKLPIYRECIMPGTELFFDVTIDDAVFPYDDERILAALNWYFDDQSEKFLDYFDESKRPSAPKGDVLYLGGGTGFVSKTVAYQIFEDPDKAAKTVQEIMTAKFPKHYHKYDLQKYEVSPHMRKCTVSGGRLYDQGLCSIAFEEI
jgi:CRISPR-associated protein Csm5